jgi:hypothetical protein
MIEQAARVVDDDTAYSAFITSRKQSKSDTAATPSYSQYREAIRDAGLEIVAWDVNYQLKYIKWGAVLRPVSAVLTQVPLLGEYFIFSVMSALSKATRHD